MGVITTSDELTSPLIPPARMFKAFILDCDNLLPKILPQFIKSMEVQGDGKAGSIRQINFVEGTGLNPMKNRVDEINEETLVFKYTVIESDELVRKFEKISNEATFEALPEGGSVCKITAKYFTLEDVVVSEEEIKAAKEKAIGMFRAVEGYLLQNPDAYAQLN